MIPALWSLLWLGMACWTEPAAPAPELQPARVRVSRELTFTMEAELFLREPMRWLEPVRFHFPAVEWEDEEGRFHFEILEGSGSAIGVDEAGKPLPILLRTRVERFVGDPLLRTEPDARIYSVRGEIYMWSDRFPLYEIEVGMSLRVPTTDGTWTAPPQRVQRDHPELLVDLARQIGTLQAGGLGGGLIGEQVEAFWGYPKPELPLFGPLFLREVTGVVATRDATARDVDLLLGRLLYVRNDYPMAVEASGVILSRAELDEQVFILQEARLIAARLPMAPAARERIQQLGHAVDALGPPSEIQRMADESVAEIRHSLWLDLAMPDSSKLDQGAALYQQHCASCHGVRGEGPPPAMAGVFPPPIPLGNPEVSIGLSPQRVWSAATFGVPGTAMTPLGDSLGDAERWAIAFYVVGMRIQGAPDEGPRVAIEDLAALSNEELGYRYPDPATRAWLRGPGTQLAARTPEWEARQAVRGVARREEGAVERLKAQMDREPSLAPLRARVERLWAAKEEEERRELARELADELRRLESP